uniref:Putative capsid protein n=1 Tax=Hammarskog picorna-like virus TaxID=2665417 RepID=A0A8K1ILR5_9VIRU|nr:putative capsid protein [Hammarskog picorna-like virus]
MSYLKTTEELNPTKIVVHPTQEVETKDENPPIEMAMPIDRQLAGADPGYKQMGWVDYAQKEKDWDKFSWPIDYDGTIWHKSIKMSTFTSLMPFAEDAQAFFTFKNLVFKIMPTTNANFQGLARICYYLFPDATYATRNKINLTEASTRRVISVDLTPSDTEPYILKIPNTLPLHWYRHNSTYLMNYHLGLIQVRILAPLATKSPRTTLEYTVRAYFEGFRTTGNYVH